MWPFQDSYRISKNIPADKFIDTLKKAATDRIILTADLIFQYSFSNGKHYLVRKRKLPGRDIPVKIHVDVVPFGNKSEVKLTFGLSRTYNLLFGMAALMQIVVFATCVLLEKYGHPFFPIQFKWAYLIGGFIWLFVMYIKFRNNVRESIMMLKNLDTFVIIQ